MGHSGYIMTTGSILIRLMTVPRSSPRSSDPRAAVLLRAVVPERLGGARESRWGAAAGTGHGADPATPRPPPLGRMPGLPAAAATGTHARTHTHTHTHTHTRKCAPSHVHTHMHVHTDTLNRMHASTNTTYNMYSSCIAHPVYIHTLPSATLTSI